MADFWKDDEGWWFAWDGEPCGPYNVKQEAVEDNRGLLRWAKHRDEPDFLTTDPNPIQDLLL